MGMGVVVGWFGSCVGRCTIVGEDVMVGVIVDVAVLVGAKVAVDVAVGREVLVGGNNTLLIGIPEQACIKIASTITR
jgi:hypothetical protein